MFRHLLTAGMTLAITLVSAGAAFAGTAALKTTAGVPFIEVDGQAASRLIFAGSKLGKPVDVSPDWQEIKYSAVCPLNDAEAFIQINLGASRGKLWIKNLMLAETSGQQSKIILSTGFVTSAWQNDWKLLDARATGAAFVQEDQSLLLNIPRRTEFPWDVQLCSRKISLTAGRQYTVSFQIRADAAAGVWPVTSYLMRMNPLRFYAASGEDSFMSTAALVTAAGANMISPLVTFPWPENPGDYEPELALTAVYLDSIIAAMPASKWLLRVGVEPPAWWIRRNPGDMQRWENGKTGNYVCVASEKWRQAVREHLARLIPLLEKKWGDRIIAYIPTAQSTGEWYYPIWDNPGVSMNHSEPFRRGYQLFLQHKYELITKLNQAWHTSYPDFAAVAVPSGNERRHADLTPFRNTATQQNLYDFAEYEQTAMREALENAAGAIKNASSGKLVFAFYGYSFELPGCQEGIGTSGHLQLGRLLRSPSLDCIVDITSYFDRGVKGTGSLMTPADSIPAHGKLLCTEDDSRTHLSAANAGYERTTSASETRWGQTRNLVRSLVHNGYTWKFDLYGTGWFNDRALWKSLSRVEQVSASQPLRPFRSDVAVIIDEKSFMALQPGIELTRPLVYDFRSVIGRAGIGEPSWWLLEDVISGIVPPHRLTIFLNAFYLSAKEKKTIGDYCRKNGGTVLWMYAPGYLNDQGEDFPGMRDLTGFNFRRVQLPAAAGNVRIAAAVEQPLKLNYSGTLSLSKGVRAYFTVVPDAGIQSMGTLPGSKDVAVAITDNSGYPSIFCAAPALNPQLLAKIAEAAGAWCYTGPGNIVITNGRLLSITAPKGGIVKVKLPEKRKINTLEDKIFNADTDNFEVNLLPGETRVFTLTDKDL